MGGKLLQWFVRFDVSAALRPSGPMAPPGADYPWLLLSSSARLAYDRCGQDITAAEQRDELAAAHSITSSARAIGREYTGSQTPTFEPRLFKLAALMGLFLWDASSELAGTFQQSLARQRCKFMFAAIRR